MNNEMRVCIAKELASPRFYDEEKFMMLLRSVPDNVLNEWVSKYSEVECAFGYCCEKLYNRGPLPDWESKWICEACRKGLDETEETDDDLDERDARGSVLAIDNTSLYPILRLMPETSFLPN